MATPDDSDPLDASWEELDPGAAARPKSSILKTQVMKPPPPKQADALAASGEKPAATPTPATNAFGRSSGPPAKPTVANGAKVRPIASRRTVLGLGAIRPPSTPPAALAPPARNLSDDKATVKTGAPPATGANATAISPTGVSPTGASGTGASLTGASAMKPVPSGASVAGAQAHPTTNIPAPKPSPAAAATASPARKNDSEAPTKPPPPAAATAANEAGRVKLPVAKTQPLVPAELEDISDTEATVDIKSSPPPPGTEEEREDEIDEDRAYFAPRVVPKAALPTEPAAPKVVINLPGAAEEVTQELNTAGLDRDRAREAMARRREPTVRIPRKDVQAVREEIAAAERAGADPASEIPVFFDSNGNPDASVSQERVAQDSAARAEDVEPTVGAPRSSSKVTLVALLVAALGVAGAATWYVTQSGAAGHVDSHPSTAADAKTQATSTVAPPDTATATATPAASTPTMASAPDPTTPPMELSAAPTASADPSVVTLNAAAAQGHPAPHTWPSAAPTYPHPPAPTPPTPYKPPATVPHVPPKPVPGKPVMPTEI